MADSNMKDLARAVANMEIDPPTGLDGQINQLAGQLEDTVISEADIDPDKVAESMNSLSFVNLPAKPKANPPPPPMEIMNDPVFEQFLKAGGLDLYNHTLPSDIPAFLLVSRIMADHISSHWYVESGYVRSKGSMPGFLEPPFPPRQHPNFPYWVPNEHQSNHIL